MIALEPYYDSYAACIAMAGATRVPVTLRAPEFRPDLDALRDAITGRTRLILLNSPHNPTGMVATRDELAAIADLAIQHDLLVVTDEVYEHLVFDGEHIPIATLPGMRERTVTISSAGKTFSFTGWKIGWVTGTPELVDRGPNRQAVPYLRQRRPVPVRHRGRAGAARTPSTLPGRRAAPASGTCWRPGCAPPVSRSSAPGHVLHHDRHRGPRRVRRARLLPRSAAALRCRRRSECGVLRRPGTPGGTQVRFAFCKREEVLADAVPRLAALGAR